MTSSVPDAAKLTPKLKELNSNLEDNVRLSDAELDHLDKVIEKVSLYHIGSNSKENSQIHLRLTKMVVVTEVRHLPLY